MTTNLFGDFLTFAFSFQQGILDFFFGIFGQTAPQLASTIGSIFGISV